MSIYEVKTMGERIAGNSYVGRGVVLGKSADGKSAVCAYFIMGRSENSRNRIFTEKNGDIFTEPFDVSKVEDPSLIIYAAVRDTTSKLIVTNGDQTDTIYEGLDRQMTFEQSLRSREFEPDAPNYTPRISGVLHVEAGCYNFAMSILKSDDGDPSSCLRQTFAYENPAAGQGRFISTYQGDGDPLPSFAGEPVKLVFDETFTADIDTFGARIWDALNADNKVSLFVRFIDIETGEAQSRILNKNQ